jgi:hypothetical protein
MTQDNTGGPAFPRYDDDARYTQDGMTLRDYFAAHASEKDLEEYRDYHLCGITGECVPRYSREKAKFRYADAMIAHKETKK